MGAREDWRYADMRARYGGHWWWMSFFLVYVVQQLMLVGITLPLYSVHASALPWNPIWDGAAAAGCLLGKELLPLASHNPVPRWHVQPLLPVSRLGNMERISVIALQRFICKFQACSTVL